jgi:hypothetical protein
VAVARSTGLSTTSLSTLYLKIMYKYLEIVKDDTKEVVSRMDVSNKSERQIYRVWDVASINLNHNEYSLQLNESKVELPKVS